MTRSLSVNREFLLGMMRIRSRRPGWMGLAWLLGLWVGASAWAGPATGDRGMVATVHPLATRAGIDALQAGGNAVDAAVACALTLGVVDAPNSGLGGGCFLVVHRADGTVVAIDGRETAPAAATREMFLRDGKAVADLSQTGPLAAGVPGELAALVHASTHFGRLPIARLLEAAARVAETGFTLGGSHAARLAGVRDELARFPAARAIYLDAEGQPWRPGTVLRQPDLAASYRAIAREGPDWFYRGAFAARTADWMAANGGLLARDDFAAYTPRRRPPVRTTYRGWEVVGFPPPSSGGVHVAQILRILEPFDIAALDPLGAEFVHLVTEAMKRAFADRAHWLGDPDHAAVPRGLVDPAYTAALARGINRERATPVDGHGTPPRADEDVFGREAGRHTTHFSTADAEGNWVACTATVNTTLGSKVVVPGTGIVLNNQMDDFAAQPGVPNFFGLLGAEANAVGPGKRPLSSMSPTLLLRDGRPVLSVGAAGGPTIITQTLLAILHVVDFGRDAASALAQPRFHHQWRPDEIRIERAYGPEVVAALEALGHRVVVVDSLGAAQAVGRGPDGRGFIGAHDPRLDGAAEGW